MKQTSKSFYYIANWKMNMPLTSALTFAKQHGQELASLTNATKKIVLCPSFPALAPLAHQLKATSVQLGAQNCAAHQKGAYTGEVSVQSLAEAGCTYCIVGHSERREYFDETNIDVAEKVPLLIAAGITPIVCVGETKEQRDAYQTHAALEEQLAPLVQSCKKETIAYDQFLIAYEPIWAIGTGQQPDPDTLATIFSWLAQKMPECTLAYGGSVAPENTQALQQIEHISGFLIGGASLDFQKLKKIVEFK